MLRVRELGCLYRDSDSQRLRAVTRVGKTGSGSQRRPLGKAMQMLAVEW